AVGSSFSGFTGYELGRSCPYGSGLGRTLSLAPTTMLFFAADSEPTEPASTTPLAFASTPSLPADQQMTRSGWFHTKSSSSNAAQSYGRAGVWLPHEFVCTRAPSSS